MFGGSVRVLKKNTETLAVASKEISLEVKTEKADAWSCFEGIMWEKMTT